MENHLQQQNYLLQFFEYEHLPEELKSISKPFGVLARELVLKLPKNQERTVALRKLLEAKDCAVRSKLFNPEGTRTAPTLPPEGPRAA